MEIQYLGGNCIKIVTKKASVIVDDNLKQLGAKSAGKADDVLLATYDYGETGEHRFLINQPGEYEISNISVVGIPARAHVDEPDQHTATMYKIETEDLRLGVVGHIYPSLTEQQLEELGTIDILFVPVGGHGFTLDPEGALQVIKKIEPKIVIPTNFADGDLKYPVPAESLEAALKTLSMEPKEKTTKLKVKSGDFAGEQTQLIVLER